MLQGGADLSNFPGNWEIQQLAQSSEGLWGVLVVRVGSDGLGPFLSRCVSAEWVLGAISRGKENFAGILQTHTDFP